MKRLLPVIFFMLISFAIVSDGHGITFGPTYGTTFSPRQCEYLGLDWKETYQAILDLPFDIIRLGAYWDDIEKEEGHFDFTDLDWQIAQAKERNLPVILTVGMKAPRWPEYHIPKWLMKKIKLSYGAEVSDNTLLQERTLLFIEQVVSRYRDEKIVRYWQVENEALNRFGGKRWRIDKEFLKKEAALVEKLDPQNREIILTAATYPNRFLRFLSRTFTKGDPLADSLEGGDILGVNVYPIIGQTTGCGGFYLQSPQKDRLSYFEDLIRMGKEKQKSIWVMELQAEPWEPGFLAHREKEKPPSGWPEGTKLTLKELQSQGYRTFLFWGAEYWYHQKKEFGNSEWWETIEDILQAKDRRIFH